MIKHVLAITVAWNCREQVLKLIESLRAQKPTVPDILVVDNASTDGTAEAIASQFPGVTLLRLPENTGGAGGFAAGMAAGCEQQYNLLWLLDGDACATPDALAALIKEAHDHPQVGAFGSRIVMANHPDIIQECGAMLGRWTGRPHFLSGFSDANAPIASREVDYVAACSLLTRSSVVRKIGVFSKELFVFFDDIEWCLRLKAAGVSIRTAPHSVVHHPFHGSKPPNPWRVYYGARNQVRVFWEYRRGLRHWLAALTWLAWGERWARRWARRGRNDLACAIRLGIEHAIQGRSGRCDELPVFVGPPPDQSVALPQIGSFRIMPAGEIGLDLGAVQWWSSNESTSGNLDIPIDSRLARLAGNLPRIRLIEPNSITPDMTLVTGDADHVPRHWPVVRWNGVALVPATRSPRWETISCLLASIPRLLALAGLRTKA